VLSSENCSLRKKIAERSHTPHCETLQSASNLVPAFRLDASVPAPSAAADIFASLQRQNSIIDVSSLSAAIFNLIPNDPFPENLVKIPSLELCLCALNAQLQENSNSERSSVSVLECCSLAQSYGKISIDEYWLARVVLSVSSLCNHGNSSSSAIDDFVGSFCRDLAAHAGHCDHRSITIICTISAIASCHNMPTLLHECFCIAFNASSTLNVIPSLLFHSARIWPAPFSRAAFSRPLLSLFIACIFDPSTQASLSESEAAHAVAFLHIFCHSRISYANVAQVVPICISSMSGADVHEAFVACKFAVSILDTASIWSSLADPIMSLLNHHFNFPSLVHMQPHDSSESHSHLPIPVCSHVVTSDAAFASENVTYCIILLGHAISEIVQQSEPFLSDTLFRISPAVNFLFRLCCRDKSPCSQLKYSPTVSLSTSDAASCTLKSLIVAACKVSQCCFSPSDFHSIDSMETLWSRLVSPASSHSRSTECAAHFPVCKRPFLNST
jgi:hypothetical protein